MPITASSLAPAVGAAVDNTPFSFESTVLERKILLIGTYDSAITDITDEEPFSVSSPEEVGDRCGFGSMLHRMAVQSFDGSQGIETWIMPQDEAGGAAQAVGDIDFVTSALTENGTMHLYVAGIPVPVNLAKGDDDDAVATKTVAAVTADENLPVDAVVNGVTSTQVDFTAKSAGPWGTGISLGFNRGFQESHPSTIVTVITPMAGGAGIPDIQDALDATGTGDDQNEAWYTDINHGYGQDTATLDALSEYNGEGNVEQGNYAELVSRPFRCLDGDVADGSSGKDALIALADGRDIDRTNGTVAVPGSYSHPTEIACLALGHAARVNASLAEGHYLDIPLSGIDPGDKVDRWTSDYTSRDTAVKHGISPTRIKNGTVYLQCLLSYYHPASVPSVSNGYRSMRDLSLIQNMLKNLRENFESVVWQGVSIVADVTKVGSLADRQKVRDIDAVLDDLVNLAIQWENLGWIFEAAFTLDKLKQGGYIEIRPGGKGFNMRLPVIFSGEAWIFDGKIQFDTSLAVVV